MVKDKEKVQEDIFIESESSNTSIINAAEIVDKDRVKYANIPNTVVDELKYLGEEYGGGNIKTSK